MRKHYLDNIRWTTVLLVGLYHVIYIFNGVAVFGVVGPFREVQYQDSFLYLCYPWFMLLLFIVSGMSSRLYLEKHTIKEFIKSRTTKLLVPSTIGVFVLGWAQGYINMNISNASESMIPESVPAPIQFLIMCLSGTGVLWFAQLLWFFSIILALIKKFEKGKLYELTSKTNIIVLVLLVIPVFLSGLVLNAPMITVYRFGYYGMGFLLGYFVFAHEEVTDRLIKYRYILIAAAAVLGVVYTVLHFGENYAEAPCYNCVSAVAFSWAMCLAVFAGFKKWGNKSNQLTQYMTKSSFGFYVFHYLPMSATAYLLHTYTQIPALPSYLITAIATFAGGFLLHEIFSRIPVLRWCLLGIKGKKKELQNN